MAKLKYNQNWWEARKKKKQTWPNILPNASFNAKLKPPTGVSSAVCQKDLKQKHFHKEKLVQCK